ncbi:MAG: transposase [Chloroflexi bacterium]|nr:transposase [Chloroflexota bacterium]
MPIQDFVSKKNIGCHYWQIDKQLHDWYEKVENADIEETLNFKSMIESNEGYVVNYFIHGETNALTEGNNSKIPKFTSSNQGARDKDFFFFRLSNYYAKHIKIIFNRQKLPMSSLL